LLEKVSTPRHTKAFPKICSIHSKDLEAFCENDMVMLCISCIIENDHKNHDLSSIDKAAQKEKSMLEATISNLTEFRKLLHESLEEVGVTTYSYNTKANRNIKIIEDFFLQIINSITERKELLKNKINTQLEKELDLNKKQEESIKYQIEKINDFLAMNSNSDEKSDLEILNNAKENSKIFGIINNLPKVKEDIKIYELNKTEEITYLKVMLNKLLRDSQKQETSDNSPIDYPKRDSIKLLDKILKSNEKIKPIKSNSLKCTPDLGPEKYSKPKFCTKLSPGFNLYDRKYTRPEIPRKSSVKRKESKSRSSKQIVKLL
jgi:hypothetical protein